MSRTITSIYLDEQLKADFRVAYPDTPLSRFIEQAMRDKIGKPNVEKIAEKREKLEAAIADLETEADRQESMLQRNEEEFRAKIPDMLIKARMSREQIRNAFERQVRPVNDEEWTTIMGW